MTDEHVVGGIVADDPIGLASAIVKRPGMYMGGPVTFERAAAFAMGLEMALIAVDGPSPLTQEDHRLLQERREGVRSDDEEREDILALQPLLARLFSALRSARLNASS